MKTPVKRLEAKADKAWSEAIRARDGKCIICGRKSNLQAHHAINRRGKKATRWDLRNGITLCVKCHLFGIHGNQVDGEFHDNYIVARNISIPEYIQEELRVIGNKIFKTDIVGMENIILALEANKEISDKGIK